MATRHKDVINQRIRMAYRKRKQEEKLAEERKARVEEQEPMFSYVSELLRV